MKRGRTNKEYKDRLFKFIFGNPENREWTLELYNAVNGSNYENAEDIKYNTIDDNISSHMKILPYFYHKFNILWHLHLSLIA